jgi:hypothetical protein
VVNEGVDLLVPTRQETGDDSNIRTVGQVNCRGQDTHPQCLEREKVTRAMCILCASYCSKSVTFCYFISFTC